MEEYILRALRLQDELVAAKDEPLFVDDSVSWRLESHSESGAFVCLYSVRYLVLEGSLLISDLSCV